MIALQRRPRGLPEQRRGIGYGHRNARGFLTCRGTGCRECATEAELALVLNRWMIETEQGRKWRRRRR